MRLAGGCTSAPTNRPVVSVMTCRAPEHRGERPKYLPKIQVCDRLCAGGSRIRTIGPRVMFAFGIGSGRFTRASGKVGVNENDGTRRSRGTDGSNPVPSSSESTTKLASCIAAVPRTGELIRVSPLTSAEYRDPLNLDQPALPSWALIRPR